MFPTLPTITPTLDLLTTPLAEDRRTALSDIRTLATGHNAADRLAARRARLTLARVR